VQIGVRRERAGAAPLSHTLDADGGGGEPFFDEEARLFHKAEG
jgi:hypothetical protein